MRAPENFVSLAAETDAKFKHLAPTGTHAFAWIARDLNENGVVGNAAAATAEKGRAVAEHQAKGFVALLKEVRAVPLSKGFGAF